MDTIKKDPNKEVLKRREEAAYTAPAVIEKRHEKGNFLAHERIAKLVDEGSFQEIDRFAHAPMPRIWHGEKTQLW